MRTLLWSVVLLALSGCGDDDDPHDAAADGGRADGDARPSDGSQRDGDAGPNDADSARDGGDARPDATPETMTPAEIAAVIRTEICERTEAIKCDSRCDCDRSAPCAPDVAGCLASFAALGSESAPTISARLARLCGDQRIAFMRACSSGGEVCGRMFGVVLADVGEECVTDASFIDFSPIRCADGLGECELESGRFVCVARRTADEECEEGDCALGFACVEGHCKATPLADGDPCAAECGPGLSCRAVDLASLEDPARWKCARPAEVSELCADDVDCATGLRCEAQQCVMGAATDCTRVDECGSNRVCNGDDGARCLATLAIGQPCDYPLLDAASHFAGDEIGPIVRDQNVCGEDGWCSPDGCERRPGLGEYCRTAQCRHGLGCLDNECVGPGALGERCPQIDTGGFCGDGLVCIGDICERRRDVDEPCASSAECAAELSCAVDPSGTGRTCRPRKAEGEDCTTTECGDSLYCEYVGAETATCQPRKAEGATCAQDSAECQVGLTCVPTSVASGVCRPPIARGEPCWIARTGDAPCEPSSWCGPVVEGGECEPTICPPE